MKTSAVLFSIIFFLIIFQSKSQTDLYQGILVNTSPTNYTVSAVNDTSFAREVVINNIDPANFKSMHATLSIKMQDGNWHVLQTANFNAPPSLNQACSQDLCFYKLNSTDWVLFVGNYTLLSSYKIQLHFETLHPTGVNYDWSDEF